MSSQNLFLVFSIRMDVLFASLTVLYEAIGWYLRFLEGGGLRMAFFESSGDSLVKISMAMHALSPFWHGLPSALLVPECEGGSFKYLALNANVNQGTAIFERYTERAHSVVPRLNFLAGTHPLFEANPVLASVLLNIAANPIESMRFDAEGLYGRTTPHIRAPLHFPGRGVALRARLIAVMVDSQKRSEMSVVDSPGGAVDVAFLMDASTPARRAYHEIFGTDSSPIEDDGSSSEDDIEASTRATRGDSSFLTLGPLPGVGSVLSYALAPPGNTPFVPSQKRRFVDSPAEFHLPPPADDKRYRRRVQEPYSSPTIFALDRAKSRASDAVSKRGEAEGSGAPCNVDADLSGLGDMSLEEGEIRLPA